MARRDKNASSPGLFSADELSGCAASHGTEPAHVDKDNETAQEREANKKRFSRKYVYAVMLRWVLENENRLLLTWRVNQSTSILYSG